MHEWALAEAVISTATRVAEKERLREITKIKIGIGELQQIDTDILQFALKEVIQPQNPLLRKAKLEIETETAVFGCRVCGHEWPFRDAIESLSEQESESIHFVPEIAHVYVRCPNCNSPDFKVVKGRGLTIHSITGLS